MIFCFIKETKNKITHLPDEDFDNNGPNPDTDRAKLFSETDSDDDQSENDNMDDPVDLKMLLKSVLKVNNDVNVFYPSFFSMSFYI